MATALKGNGVKMNMVKVLYRLEMIKPFIEGLENEERI